MTGKGNSYGLGLLVSLVFSGYAFLMVGIEGMASEPVLPYALLFLAALVSGITFLVLLVRESRRNSAGPSE